MPASPTLTATLEMSRIKLKVKISRVFHSTWTKINVALLVVTLELSETCNHLSQRVSRATRLNILFSEWNSKTCKWYVSFASSNDYEIISLGDSNNSRSVCCYYCYSQSDLFKVTSHWTRLFLIHYFSVYSRTVYGPTHKIYIWSKNPTCLPTNQPLVAGKYSASYTTWNLIN